MVVEPAVFINLAAVCPPVRGNPYAALAYMGFPSLYSIYAGDETNNQVVWASSLEFETPWVRISNDQPKEKGIVICGLNRLSDI